MKKGRIRGQKQRQGWYRNIEGRSRNSYYIRKRGCPDHPKEANPMPESEAGMSTYAPLKTNKRHAGTKFKPHK